MITSKTNNTFKLLKRLLTTKGRRDTSMFLAEGKRFLSMKPKEIYSLSDEYIQLDPKLFNEISTLDNSEGYISLFDMKNHSLENILKDNGLNKILILDRIQNPENLGAIARSAHAFGFNALVIMRGSCDPYNPKAIRASMGSILSLKICFGEDIRTIQELARKYLILAADIRGENLDNLYGTKDKENNTNIALILGSESFGIDQKILDIAKLVKIPMSDSIDSLNVAVASGIIMYLISNK